MNIAVKQSSRLASRSPARLVASRRYPSRTARNLHASPPTRLAIFPWGSEPPHNQDGPPGTSHDSDTPDIPPQSHGQIASKGGSDGPHAGNSQPSNDRSAPTTGSGKRWIKSRRYPDLPAIYIPDWFLDRNVKLNEEFAPLTEGELALVGKQDEDGSGSEKSGGVEAQVTAQSSVEGKRSSAGQQKGDAEEQQPDTSRRIYHFNQALMNEIVASISGGLSIVGAEPNESFPVGKSHLKLHCPMDGGTYFLEKIVEESASQLNADIVRIDAQDLSEIVGDYINEGNEAYLGSYWSLGYDAQIYPPPQPSKESEETNEEGDEEAGAEEDEKDGRPLQPQISSFAIPLQGASQNFSIDLHNVFKRLQNGRQGPGNNGPRGGTNTSNTPGLVALPSQQNNAQQWNDLKLSALLETLIASNQAKRLDPSVLKDIQTVERNDDGKEESDNSPSSSSVSGQNLSEAHENPTSTVTTRELLANNGTLDESKQPDSWPIPRTIVLIRGFKEMNMTNKGGFILEKLLNVVQQKKKKDGQQIMIVGTTSSSELTPDISRAAFEGIQTEGSGSLFRTMVVTPAQAGPSGGFYYREERRRVREVNVRHLHDMIRRFSSSAARSVPQDLYEFATELNFGPDHAELSAMLEEQVFTFDEVHRIALTAIGNQSAAEGDHSEKEPLQAHHIVAAMNLLEESDEIKIAWAAKERQLQKPQSEAQQSKTGSSNERLKKIRQKCNHHEKVLMRGVVNPENIRITFNDVHAPQETITSLKTLTTLSLTRPEAFKYGVLATDKITGCLLYGPPGTGKTLLAKAVAKESGATVLEVSGSDVYDMYVGESEKNVRAIFTLAKKLSPCVVFIDEADAIFASRGSGTNRNSHRELINQFLREWDGMTDTSAFIMVATNRPFDLDDAALRRLPRRLLVDLPTEKDREAILGIHLKDEKLDSGISLAHLASQTQLYSGSDLKNLAVAAALTAVREENEAAAKHKETSDEAFEYPERRTLVQRHFDKAMEEITASVNEDMSSLGAIRKFDEKYGDRRGRRKKTTYGFTGGEGVKEDAAKVRS